MNDGEVETERRVQRHFFADDRQMMWPGDRNDFRSMPALVRFPNVGVTILDTPFAGRLPAGDIIKALIKPLIPPAASPIARSPDKAVLVLRSYP